MSSLATDPGVSARPAPAREQRPLSDRHAVAARLVAFTALAGFAAFNYAGLVNPVPVARVLGVVATSAVLAAALAASRRLRWRRVARVAAMGALVVAAAAASLFILGVPATLLEPVHWPALAGDISQGFGGLDSFQWPYSGDDPWIRLSILIALPGTLVPAAALAFWPVRRGAAAMRAAALAFLLLLYGIGVTEAGADRWALRGAVLLVLIGLWLWLPRLRGPDARRAALLLGVGGIVALAIAPALPHATPWFNYRDWNWFSGAASGTQFQWDQIYGPITWPRDGTLLFDVRDDRAHYWKVETLDRFDGIRWLRSDAPDGVVGGDLPRPLDQSWIDQATITIAGLRSAELVGAGTLVGIDTSKVTSVASDGTAKVLDAPLQRGDTYTIQTYAPNPTPQQLEKAPTSYPPDLIRYTYFDLPSGSQSGLKAPDFAADANGPLIGSRTVSSPAPGVAPDVNPSVAATVAASPYGRMFAVARGLAAGHPSTYAVVQGVYDYLQRGFTYSERPPNRRYPLEAFLFQDRAGYCQQFSGAMALMLRMDGIPARVAAGFAPGEFDPVSHDFKVRDWDAHAWVEVYFSGIGWVPFDPTPPLAPAVSRAAGAGAPLAARPLLRNTGPQGFKRLDTGRSTGLPGSRRTARSARGSGVLIPLAIVAAAFAAALAAWFATLARAQRHRNADPDGPVRELRRALVRLGYPVAPRATLSDLERTLGQVAGEPAARYARLLREQRFAPPGRPAAAAAPERRELRRALVARRGPLVRLRGMIALPPDPLRFRRPLAR